MTQVNGARLLTTGVLVSSIFWFPITTPAQTTGKAGSTYKPPACVVPATVELAGSWQADYGLAGATAVFNRRPDGEFDVEFTTWGCLGGDKMKRRARLERGAVVFDRPVREYVPIEYSRLWVIEVGAYSEPILVPPQAEDDIRRAYVAGGCRDFGAIFESLFHFRKQRKVRESR